jgi:PilZ domain
MPIRFRKDGGTEWSEGTTINISTSGVLFRATHLLEVKTPLHLVIALTADVGGRQAGRIVGQGTIVRHATDAEGYEGPVIAAVIRRARITPAKEGFRKTTAGSARSQ